MMSPRVWMIPQLTVFEHSFTTPTFLCSEACTYPGACYIGNVNKASNLRGTISFAANTREDFCAESTADVCDSEDKGGLILANEIFINTIDNPQYDTVAGSGFAPVGKVISGMSGVCKLKVVIY